MKFDDLVAEGTSLARTATLLKTKGEYIAGHWYKTDHTRSEKVGKKSYLCWLAVDSYFLPDIGGGIDGKLTVFADAHDEGGKVAVTPEFSDRKGIELYSEEIDIPAPWEAIRLFGSDAAKSWFAQKSIGAQTKVVQQYENDWLKKHLVSRDKDVFAYCQGWPETFASSLEWNEMNTMTLCVTTLKHSEPWIEVWQTESGDFKVLQHVS